MTEARKIYMIQYRINNKEKIKVKQKEHHNAHIEENKVYNKKWKEENKEKVSEYNKENRDKRKEQQKIYREENKNKIKEYIEQNKEKINRAKKEYRDKNKEGIKIYNNNYKATKNIIAKEKRKNNPLFKLSCNIKSNIGASLRNNGFRKKSKTHEILGCSFEEFKLYIESKFETWMNWNNYGNWNGYSKNKNISWDVDHIIPTSSVNTEEDIIKFNHYTNLQPLCSYTNRHIKRAKIL